MSAVLANKPNPVAEHFIGRLMDAEVKRLPYLHAYITRAFPEYYYQEILENLPPDAKYTDRQFDNRMMVSVNDLDAFWRRLGSWMLSREVIGTLLDVFEVNVNRIHAEVRLVRDTQGYKIKPHTDIKSKLLSLLFYLAVDDAHAEEGTTIMIPKKEGFTSDGLTRYPFEDFDGVYTAPFMPNTVLGFPRSEVSFHGVLGTTIPRRDVLLLNMYR